MHKRIIKRGDVIWVDFGQRKGSEQSGRRLAIVVQNDIGNKHSSTVIVLPMTGQAWKCKLPTHTLLQVNDINNLVYGEQITTIDKLRILSDMVYHVDDMSAIDKVINKSLGII